MKSSRHVLTVSRQHESKDSSIKHASLTSTTQHKLQEHPNLPAFFQHQSQASIVVIPEQVSLPALQQYPSETSVVVAATSSHSLPSLSSQASNEAGNLLYSQHPTSEQKEDLVSSREVPETVQILGNSPAPVESSTPAAKGAPKLQHASSELVISVSDLFTADDIVPSQSAEATFHT